MVGKRDFSLWNTWHVFSRVTMWLYLIVWPRLLSTCVMCGISTRSASSHAPSFRFPSYLSSFVVLLFFVSASVCTF